MEKLYSGAEILYRSLYVITPILLALVGWFAARFVKKVDENVKENADKIALFSERLSKLEGEHSAYHKGGVKNGSNNK